MRIRFSLRALLIAFTLAVALCVWRDAPRRLASEFAEAINAGQYDAAFAMCIGANETEMAKFLARDYRNRISAEVTPQSRKQWLSGECIVAVDFIDFGGLGGNFGLHMIASGDGIQPAGPHEIFAARAEALKLQRSLGQ